ncbi:MAG: 50S ribosomal protein L9 [Gammaproteobacteria bacterium]|nr:50S ribosomal protein L9 [Gammaproteobacteria bacterium]
MDVILLDKVQGLGQLGDTARVKPGYARNYLIPQGKAVRATKANIEQFEAERAELERKQAERLSAAQKRADQFAGVTLEVQVKAGDEGKLFGSVGPSDIVEAAAAKGIEIERSEVRMADGPLRQTGDYEIEVRVHTDVATTVRVDVVAA